VLRIDEVLAAGPCLPGTALVEVDAGVGPLTAPGARELAQGLLRAAALLDRGGCSA